MALRRTVALFLMTKAAPPSHWQRNVKKLSPESLLPGAETQKFAAFIGDKKLGAAAATWIRDSSSSTKDPAAATTLCATALSNQFLAERLDTILPGDAYTEAAKHVNAHSVGTMVEAAVAAADEEAVQDLVGWLLQEAILVGEVNAKSRLLELNGTITTSRMGGSDHRPRFQAVALLESHSEQATGNSKKDAERRAARMCLTSLGYVNKVMNSDSEMDEELVEASSPLNQWNPFDGMDKDLTLKDGETLGEWWTRGMGDPKRGFRRALLAPIVFDTIIAVDSWTRRNNDGDAAVLMVVLYTTSDGVESSWSCTKIAKSATLARTQVALEANELISQVTGTRRKVITSSN